MFCQRLQDQSWNREKELLMLSQLYPLADAPSHPFLPMGPRCNGELDPKHAALCCGFDK